MRKEKRGPMRLIGKRLERRLVYLIIFVGFFLFAAAVNGVHGFENLFFLILCCVPIVLFGFYLIRRSITCRFSSLQIKEVTETYPDASLEQLYEACERHSRREIRQEALLLLIFAAGAAIGFLMLYFAEAAELALFFTLWILIPALLLIAAAMLIASLIPHRIKQRVPLLETLTEDEERQKSLLDRAQRPDRRYSKCTILVLETDAPPSFETAASAAKTAYKIRNRYVMLWQRIGIGFFIILPGVLFLLTLPLIANPEISYLPFLSAAPLAAGFVIIGAVRSHDSTFPYSAPKTGRLIRALPKQGRLMPDRVLSATPDTEAASTAEICFAEAGTIRWKEGSDAVFQRFLHSEGQEACLLMSGRELLAAFLIRPTAAEQETDVSASEAAPTAEPSEKTVPAAEAIPAAAAVPAAAAEKAAERKPEDDPDVAEIMQIVAEGGVPTDEQLREAGRNRYETMDPARKKAYEADIIELHELSQSSSLNEMTPAAKERLFSLMHRCANYAAGDRFRDLTRLEETMIEEGGLKREEINNHIRNPIPLFPKAVWIPLLAVTVLSAGGAVATAWIERETGAELSIVRIILSSVSGLGAFTAAGRWVSVLSKRGDFRKLKKAYKNPAYWDERIETEAYKELEARLKQNWES